MRSTTTESRAFAVAAGAVVVALAALASTAIVAWRSQGVAADLTDNAAASMASLSEAQADLRRIRVWLYDGGYPPADWEVTRERVRAARDRLHRHVADYSRQPAFPGETEALREIQARLEDYDRPADVLLGRASAPSMGAAAELGAVGTELGHAIAHAIDINAAEMPRLRRELAFTQRRLIPLAVATASLALAAAATAVVSGRRLVRAALARSLESERLLHDRSEELEAFAGRVAHDLLSPLMTTSLALSMAERDLPADAPARSAVTRGSAATQRVRALVEGLFEFARAGARPEPGARADVRLVVEDVVSGFVDVARDAGIAIQIDVRPDLTAACSVGALTSIVSNLVQNAIKFVSRSEARRVRVAVREQAGRVEIEVRDTGPGVPAELRSTLFEPFVRGDGRAPGLGLGLATVKKLVLGHGGEVCVSSNEDGGATFVVALPVASHADAERSPAPVERGRPACL